jgi:hypothetical protein
MRFTRARVAPGLLIALASAGAVAVQSPASAAVTSTNITTPLDGAHYLVTVIPSTKVTVAGTSNGTTGDFVDINCYSVGSSDWQPGPEDVPIQADGSFSVQMAISDPYQTCRLKAVPANYAEGGSLTNFTGPRVTSEFRREFKVQSGPNAGKLYDYGISFQGAEAAFDMTSATNGGYWDSRLTAADGSSSNYFWDSTGASLRASSGDTRSRVRVDGRNAYGPASAANIQFGAPIPGLPALTWSVTRDGVTGVTKITEKNPLVACPVGTPYPANGGNCASLSSVGVRLERSYVVTDKGRQVHLTDVWRSTDGKSHVISAFYQSEVHGIDYRGIPDTVTDVAFKLPWVGGFQTFGGDATYPSPSKLANSILVRDSNTSLDGDTILPRGALTFDFPAKVHRTDYNALNLEASTFTVPAKSSRTLRQSFVIGSTDASVLAKAKSNETRINPYRPDAWIKVSGAKYFKGNNVYNTTGGSQAVCCAKTYVIAIQNDGTRTDSFRIRGDGAKSGFGVKYLAGATGNTSITYDVTHGTYAVRNLPPGEKRYLRLVLTFPSPNGQVGSWLISATSLADGTRKDVVKATVQMAIARVPAW